MRPGSSEPARRSVLLVGTDLSTGGGVNRVIAALAGMFSERLGLDTTVIAARSGADPTFALPPGVRLERFPEGQSLPGYLRVLLKLRRRRYDYAIGFWPQDNLALLAAFLASRTRVIAAEHVSWFHPGRMVRAFRALLYRAAWRVIVLNPADLLHYRRLGIPRVTLIPNPVAGQPGSVAREKLILGVGHLSRSKNFSDLVAAMAASELEREGWSLAIVGGGPEEEGLRAQIARLGLRNTRIVPPTNDIQAWYRRAALLVSPSTLDVFSLVIAEAALAGAAPLAYAADGPAFLLEDFPDHLVPVGDVAALAAALGRLARDPHRAARVEAIGRVMAERFSPERVAEQWRELLV